MRALWFSVMLGIPALTGGCSTLAKQAYYEVRGADAELLFVSTPDATGLRTARALESAPARTELGPRLVPPNVLRAADTAVDGALARLRAHYPGGEPAAHIESDVLYFQRKGLLSGGLLLTRVRMTVGGTTAFDAVVKSESKSFREGGEDDLARAHARALEQYLLELKTPPAQRDR